MVNWRVERRFRRTTVYLNRKYYVPNDPPKARRSRHLPKCNMRSRRSDSMAVTGYDIRDRMGAVGNDNGFTNVCLITALRSLGVPISPTRDGPFRALADGNDFLRPHGRILTHTPWSSLLTGKYVKWHQGHFTAVFVEGSRVTVIDSETTATFRSVGDLGRADDHLWFRLDRLDNSEHEATGQVVSLHATKARVDANRARALIIRQRLQDQNRQRVIAGLTDPVVIQRRQNAMAIRASRLVRPLLPQHWPSVTPPDDPNFIADLCLPPATFLGHLNAHPRDSRLVFYDETHTYLIDGCRSLGSVTGLIHAFAAPFIEKDVICKMVSGNRWPRPEYLRATMPQGLSAALVAFPEATELCAALTSPHFDPELVCQLARKLVQTNPLTQAIVESMSLNQAEIRRMWENNRVLAARQGTWMHWRFEAFLNRIPISEDGHEFKLFRKFISRLGGLCAYRTEWTIFGDDEWLAGSIDFVAVDANDNLIIFDWKRSKNLRAKYESPFGRMLPPLQHIHDCQGWHYRLQLNAYRFILEKYYGKRVLSMHVVCTHPDNLDEPFVDDVPVLKDEIETMMSIQRTRVREISSLALHDERLHDPLGGGGLDDADGLSFTQCVDMEGDMDTLEETGPFSQPAAAVGPGGGSASSAHPPANARALTSERQATAPDERERPSGATASSGPAEMMKVEKFGDWGSGSANSVSPPAKSMAAGSGTRRTASDRPDRRTTISGSTAPFNKKTFNEVDDANNSRQGAGEACLAGATTPSAVHTSIAPNKISGDQGDAYGDPMHIATPTAAAGLVGPSCSQEQALVLHSRMDGDNELVTLASGAGNLSRVRQRRQLPGGASSHADFKAFFEGQTGSNM